MRTKSINTKRHLILLVSFFISVAASAQQNVLGFKGTNVDLISINLRYFANGQITENPDRTIDIGVANTYEMHQMKFPKLTYYIYNDIRFADDKLFVSSAGSEERIIDVNVVEKMKGEEWGKAVLSCEYATPIEIDFSYREQQNILMIQYIISDRDNEDYLFERDSKIAEGRLAEVEEYEKFNSYGVYLVSIVYLIK
jgi:hypothetical protein